MTDRRVFQSVVMFLGVTLLLALVAIAVLTGFDKTAPSILENLAVGSLTGLAGLLVRGPSPDEPQSVTVVNNASDPVQVEDAGAVDIVTALLAVFLVIVILVVLGVV